MKSAKLPKKIIAIALAACMLGGTAATGVGSYIGLSTTVNAAETTASDFEYQINGDGTLDITRYRGSAENLVIPSEIDGKAVTAIGSYAFKDCANLTSVKIPDSVTSIGDSAFYNCSALTSITIPDSVKSIGNYAFYSCGSLTSITIPDSVTSIGVCAFHSCVGLTSITIPNSVTSIGYGVFSFCTELKSITVNSGNPEFSSQDGVLFKKDKTVLIAYPCAKSETTYKIPDSVISIGKHAFINCKSLTSITIPNSVTSIGDSAFNNCSNLSNVIIPNSVTSIGNGAFYNCYTMKSITIPNSVTSIDEFAFRYCSGLTSVIIPNNVTSIGANAFSDCHALKNIIIPNSVTSIGDYAFYNCVALTSVIIPDSVTSIGNYAFKNCDNLTIYGVKGSAAETYANEKNIPFFETLFNKSTLSKKTINFGDALTITGKATGGTAPYKYSFLCKHSTEMQWTTLTSYGTTSKRVWQPKQTGIYSVRAKIKDATGKESIKDFVLTVNPALANNSTMNKTTINFGDALTITGNATDGTAPYKYSFLCKHSTETKWTTLTSYGTTSKRVWQPKKTGTYTVRTKVKDATGKEVIKDFTLTVNPALVNNSTMNKTTINFGDALTITGKAANGTAPYQYTFLCKHSTATKWTTLTSYGTTSKRVWQPKQSGTYTVRTKVKDATGKEVIKDFTLTVK